MDCVTSAGVPMVLWFSAIADPSLRRWHWWSAGLQEPNEQTLREIPSTLHMVWIQDVFSISPSSASLDFFFYIVELESGLQTAVCVSVCAHLDRNVLQSSDTESYSWGWQPALFILKHEGQQIGLLLQFCNSTIHFKLFLASTCCDGSGFNKDQNTLSLFSLWPKSDSFIANTSFAIFQKGVRNIKCMTCCL